MAGENRDSRTDSFRWANQVRSGIRDRLWDQNKRGPLTVNEAVEQTQAPEPNHDAQSGKTIVVDRW